MAMDLGKSGVAYDLAKETGTEVTNLEVKLTWPANAGDGNDFDPDVVAFGLGDDGKVVNGNEGYFVKGFPSGAPKTSPDGSIFHGGDDTKGGTGEKILIDTTKFAPGVTQVDVAVTIFEAVKRQQNFGTFGRLRVTVTNLDNGKEIGSGNLSLAQSAFTAARILSVIVDGGKTYVQTNITGFNGGLGGLAQGMGVNIGKNSYDV
jgi:tellurium resistance protein TerD